MDSQRLFLVLILSMILMLMWQAWQQDYGPQPPVAQSQPQSNGANGANGQTNTQAQDGSVPRAELTNTLPSQGNKTQSAQRIQIRTDLFEGEIDTQGGDLRVMRLRKYPVALDKPEQPFTLLADNSERLFVAQSGLVAVDSEAPNHYALYQADALKYEMAEGAEQLEVRLHWQGEQGIAVDKIYTFTRDSYNIDVRHEIRNQSPAPWQGLVYRQLQHGVVPESDSQFGIYTYTGGVIYTEAEKYEKIDFSDMGSSPVKRHVTGGWTAMIQHYFLAAWVPNQSERNQFYSKQVQGPRYILGMKTDPFRVAAGEQGRHETTLVVGPKIQSRLEPVAEGLELTVDYGMLTVIAKPIFWLLQQIQGVVHNWGWSIIILTILIKLVFYKLSETSYKSMANMRKLQPRLKTIREQYGDDKQKLNQAMMDLYRTEKINPLGGCLPILVQIPVFIALYWVLLESVELRQAPFMLWIQDLSAMDPYYVLPILMGASMFIQQRLNPTPPDPIQAKIMMGLPFVFTVFFLFFPAGLVLYWLVNNILSIAQQWVITKRVEAGQE